MAFKVSSFLFLVLLKALYHSRDSPNRGHNLSNHNDLEDALDSFRRMLRTRPLPCTVRLGQLLIQISRMKHFSVVVSLDRQMGLLGVRPDEYTLSIVINCFCHLNLMGFGMSVFGKFVKLGCEPTTVTMNTLIKGFLNEGKIDEARECYEKLVEGSCKQNVVTYSTLLGF